MGSEFVEPGEVRPKDEEQLYCFLNQTRPCTAECVSYMVATPHGNEYINQKWVHCMLLVSVHRLTKIADKGLQVYSNRVADEQRAGNAPYRNVDPVTGRVL